MYPHERSLVQEMQGQPFALLGINSDSKDRVLAAIRRENITWRSWWDGGNTSGPIAKAWKIRAWPTIYVLDHTGVIRYKNVRGSQLDAAVKKLVAEVGGSRP